MGDVSKGVIYYLDLRLNLKVIAFDAQNPKSSFIMLSFLGYDLGNICSMRKWENTPFLDFDQSALLTFHSGSSRVINFQ